MSSCFRSAVFVLVCLFTIHAYAQKMIKLAPKESKSLTNHYAWTLNATCNVQNDNTKSKIRVSILNNKGKVNGRNLSQGQATFLMLKNNDQISVSAEPGTRVYLVNVGASPVQATCSV
ncbi:hypothetical protein [Legionella nagasakiensis]|uniref:hypothetical protein n=1 Tax=Legionella nagasakiensis TaxID=535290 RepID=UPI001055D83A|nr:hypothetical protein [Legionella nagasakiensis]